jgi:ubiquitin-protein ligase
MPAVGVARFIFYVCTVGFFLTKIFHPNVAKNGAICVNTLKRDWKAEHGIKHILLVS